MARVLLDNTVVDSGSGPVALLKGSPVPAWARPLIGEHLLGDDAGDAGPEPGEPVRPPESGAGGGAAAWRRYAEALGVDSSGTRAEIIARIDGR